MIPSNDPKQLLLQAALPHVPFDGWGYETFQAAITDSGLQPAVAKSVCPRGGVDLALTYHANGDAAMLEKLAQTDLDGMRFRDKIAFAVRTRFEVIDDPEVVRRALALFALPNHAPDGMRAVWGTCDAIWTALGDVDETANWYSKRLSLSGVYSSTLLYWLGDQSEGHAETWTFLERRIDNVMQFEKVKAQVQNNPALKPLAAIPEALFSMIKPPKPREGMPGVNRPDRGNS